MERFQLFCQAIHEEMLGACAKGHFACEDSGASMRKGRGCQTSPAERSGFLLSSVLLQLEIGGTDCSGTRSDADVLSGGPYQPFGHGWRKSDREG
jgi:hypothetical protein